MEKRSPRQKTVILREISSGGVVYKKEGKNIYWLVTHSAPSTEYPMNYWRLPKGWIDDEDNGLFPGPYSRGDKRATSELLEKTAIREVQEEGGINVKVVSKIGTEKYVFNSKSRKARVFKFVTFFLMVYVSDRNEGLDSETSEVLWLLYDKAYKKLSHGGEKQMLKKAREILKNGTQSILI